MSTKTQDMKDRLKMSLSSKAASLDDRFNRAQEVMKTVQPGTALGVLSATSFSAESYDNGPTKTSFSAERSENGRIIRQVAVAVVHDNPYNARKVYIPERVKELSASIATSKQLVPCYVVPHPDLPGEYILIDGQYRKRAVIDAGINELFIEEGEPITPIEMYRLSREFNKERTEQTVVDDAFAWTKLVTDGVVKTEAELAIAVNESAANVNKTLAVLKLPSQALDKVFENPSNFSMTCCYELFQLSQLVTLEKLLDIIEDVANEKISGRGVETLRKSLQNKVPRKPKEISRQYKINLKEVTGYLKDWDTGKITFEININDMEKRLALLEELKVKFQVE